MQRESYGNYNTNVPLKVFAGNVAHASQCNVEGLTQKVDDLERKMAQQYPLQCTGCPDQKVVCSDANDPKHCKALQFECLKQGCYSG